MSRGNVHELEKQVGGWDTHGTGDVLSDVCASPRRSGARRGLGAVPDDCGGVGYFCFVVCEVEVGGGFGGANSVGLIGWRCDARGRMRYGRSASRFAMPKCGVAARWLPRAQVRRAQMTDARE